MAQCPLIFHLKNDVNDFNTISKNNKRPNDTVYQCVYVFWLLVIKHEMSLIYVNIVCLNFFIIRFQSDNVTLNKHYNK